MSRKSRLKKLKYRYSHIWKMIDDMSGLVIYSNEAVMDHKGRITAHEWRDPIHPIELPYPNLLPVETIPWVRPRGPVVPRDGFESATDTTIEGFDKDMENIEENG